MVVLTSRCPSSSWTVRMSCPSSSRWVANEWRKGGRGGGGQHRPPVPVPLAGAHHNLVRCKVDVFHAEPGALEHAESRPVQEQCHQSRDAVELAEDGSNLFAGQDDW